MALSPPAPEARHSRRAAVIVLDPTDEVQALADAAVGRLLAALVDSST